MAVASGLLGLGGVQVGVESHAAGKGNFSEVIDDTIPCKPILGCETRG